MATSPGASGSFDFSQFDAATRVQFAADIHSQAMMQSILLNPHNGWVKRQKGKTPVNAPFVFRHELMPGNPGEGNTGIGTTIRFFVSFQTGGGTSPRGVDLKTVAGKANYTHFEASINENWASFADHYPDTVSQVSELVPFKKANPQIATRISFLHELKLIMELAGYAPTTSTTNTGYIDVSGTPIDPANPDWLLQDAGGITDYPAGSPFRVFPVASGVSDEQSITNSHPITTDQIKRAVKVFRRVNAGVEPLRIKGQELFLLILHPDQYSLLLDDTAFKQVNWYGPAQGGIVAPGDNVRVTGKVAQWEDVLIVQHPMVPYGINASTGAPITTVRRAILCGANSAVMGSGRRGAFDDAQGQLLDFRRENENFGQKNYVATCFWSGIKRVRFTDNRDLVNTERSNTCILPSYTG